MEWLGCTLRYLGDLPESRRLLEEAVVSYTRQGAGETEDCMKAMSHLATTLSQLELVPEACALRRRILEVRNLTLGADDPRTLRFAREPCHDSALASTSSMRQW